MNKKMMKIDCSHGIQYGEQCEKCAYDLKEFIRNKPQEFNLKQFKKEVSEEYPKIILKYDWELFCSLTFRNQHIVGPEFADKRFKRWIRDINYYIFGKHFRRNRKGINWVCAMEKHKSGVIHFHALLNSDPPIYEIENSMRHIQKLWFEECGWANIQKIKKSEAVSSYLAKYVTKGGELTFSERLIERKRA
tara:strand:+ start:1699 stop:2271 length:573 start_codon:yes stop_codon:yes gene_type:complete